MTGLLAGLAGASFLLTLLITPLVIRIARRTGFLDLPGPRKIHTEPIPYGGGLAVALATLGTIFFGLKECVYNAHSLEISWRGVDLGVFRGSPSAFLVYGLGSLVILVLGLVDDRKKLSAFQKLGVQAVVAVGVALGGERFELFEFGTVPSVAVTVLWILAVTNAFNLLDHMDGLSAGVAALTSAAFLIVALQTGQYWIALILVPFLGACLGFLVFNFPPARIFLGDAGSLFVGFWLSCLTISFTFYERAHHPLYTYFVPLAVLAVPLFDTASVVFIRLKRRTPIFQGDTNHLAHRLTALGMSRRGAVLTVYALTLYTGLSAVLLYHVPLSGAVIILVQLLLTFGIITLLEVAGRTHGDTP